jgi:hypothetical protein
MGRTQIIEFTKEEIEEQKKAEAEDREGKKGMGKEGAPT